MRPLWAAALLLRRLRGERGIAVLLFLVVAATSFLFAATPRLFNRVSDDALQYAVRTAPAGQRDLALLLASRIAPGPDGGVSGAQAYGEQLAAQLPPTLSGLLSAPSLRATTPRFYVSNPPNYETHIALRYQDGLTDETRLVSGRWPTDRGVPLRQARNTGGSGTTEGGAQAKPVILEVALSTSEATEIGVGVGDRLAVTLDATDPLLARTRMELDPTEIQVVGLYEPLDATSEYWSGDASLLEVSQVGTLAHPVADATAYVAADTYPTLWDSGMPFRYEWRFVVDPERLDAGQLTGLEADLRRLNFVTGASELATPGIPVGRTGLLTILDRFDAQRAASESILAVAAIGPFGLAAGAMAMVAILLVWRQRATLALARGRGASGALVLGTQLWEAILVAGGGSLAGLLVAMAVVPGRASPLSSALATAVTAAATLLIVGASYPIARRPLGQLERNDQQGGRVTPRRLVIESTIVGSAIAGALLLRQRGLAIDAPGEVVRFDPLLAAVPVLLGLAAGIIALRLYPLPVRALGWLAARRRDLVPVLGLRTVGRQPAAANLPLLVLMLTAAFGAFSAVVVSSVDRGQVAASYLAVGADYRIEKVGIGSLGSSLDPGAIPGVVAVAPGIVDTSAGFSSTAIQRATVYLDVIDPRAYEAVAGGTAADPDWPDAMLADPTGDGPGADDNPIPAILSVRVPFGSADLAPGGTFHMEVDGQTLSFRVTERRTTFPGIGNPPSFAIVPFSWVQAALQDRPPLPSVLWLRAPASVAPALATAIADVHESARVVSRHDAYAALHDAPLGAAVADGFGLALGVAAVYMALTILGALVLSAARRTQDLAYLRTLGISTSQSVALTVVEHAPPVLLALIPGLALGVGVAFLVGPALGLATFVGASGVPLYVDWPTLALLVAGLILVVAGSVTVGTWLARRARLVDALRMGDD